MRQVREDVRSTRTPAISLVQAALRRPRLLTCAIIFAIVLLVLDTNQGYQEALYIPTIISSTGQVDRMGRASTRPAAASANARPGVVLSNATFGVRSVGVFHVFRKPPWGGGNQFLMALVGEYRRRGIKVVENIIEDGVDLYMANAVTFKTEPFREAARKRPKRKGGGGSIKLVHRLDGPYYSSRYAKDPRVEASDPWRAKEDDRVFDINKEFACATIFQSRWSYEMNLALGYSPVTPMRIIPNAVDPKIFHAAGRATWDEHGRRTRLLSSSWADNMRKGFATFQWLDENLDFTVYDYTFLGNVPEGFSFRNLRVVPPVTSEELAPELRQHDIYLATSFLEPCSNALLEALASGMPVVYQDGSGHGELVKDAGLSYKDPAEIPSLLARIRADYRNFQARIDIMSINQVADAYLEVYSTCFSSTA